MHDCVLSQEDKWSVRLDVRDLGEGLKLSDENIDDFHAV